LFGRVLQSQCTAAMNLQEIRYDTG
jgi:hypothetical protein